MTVGFIMLCHTAFDRAAQVARYWAEAGSPVVIHVDARVKAQPFARLKAQLADLGNVRFSDRFACEWGSWGLVAATLGAGALMLRDFAQVDHVFLASGACLPLRPVADLEAYLAARPGTDFIESVTTEDVGWTVGGLDRERFTLRFPFSWRSQRALFDGYVRLQRRAGFSRTIPAGVEPHLGSQWWCLTRGTLAAILNSPDRRVHDAYFRRVWIPDESYFQSLVRRYSGRIESRSLTLSKFDFQGKPHIFYDDHLGLLRRSDCLVARKIWPHANQLYKTFLAPDGKRVAAEPNPGRIDKLFSKAVDRRVNGRPGLYMQSRFPDREFENGRTAAPYSAFQGFADVFPEFEPWLGRMTGGRVHGHLFAPDRVHFAGGEAVFHGGLSDSAKLRDYNPRSFLTSLLWNARGERQCFQTGPGDNQALNEFMAGDVNAQISVISGAFALPLFHSGLPFAEVRKEVARLQKIEAAHLALLRASWVKARVRIWPLAEFLENPMDPLQTIVEEIAPRLRPRLADLPRMADFSGFGRFLQDLRNQGMQPTLMGDYPASDDFNPGRDRPFLVS
ncbi:DUF5927 domain-containing protein [Falsirhodobacter xinxiangensis]|uniref:DUF5927 domain-containing protein n=1 Tax=Falsirhodobacter xinxiangensis TaxID=2530049 RepID=UPI0010AA6358|nr:beta-1,6-N-acetylglucosaminyltransferase [Rhodobacter xinxiangensis]